MYSNKTIKNILITSVMFLSFIVTIAQNSFAIEGTIKGVNEGTAKIVNYDFNYTPTVLFEGTIGADGSFSISGNTTEPSLRYLRINDRYEVAFFLESGIVKIDLDIDDYSNKDDFSVLLNAKLAGTTNNDILGKFVLSKAEMANTPEGIEAKIFSKKVENLDYDSKDPDVKALFEENTKLWDSLNVKFNKRKFKLFEESKGSLASLYLLVRENGGVIFDSSFDLDQKEYILKGVNPQAKASKFYEQLEAHVQSLRNTKIGVAAPTFTLKNEKGSDISLSDFKGKYVLIDFWAYWCVPCVESFPHLKELYEKYHKDGFEILGVSHDTQKGPWLDALSKYKNPWPQVIEPAVENVTLQEVSNNYNIQFLPTTYLIDPEGKILDKNLFEEELETKLKELFNK